MAIEIPKDYLPLPESQHDLYKVQLEVFDGPLDLLLLLIKRHKLDIFDIPIAFICERYFAYLENLESLNIDVAAEFLFMASELVHIKAKFLLPSPVADDAEEEIRDPRAELVRRLLEYQKYKQAVDKFSCLPRLDWDVFARLPESLGKTPVSELAQAAKGLKNLDLVSGENVEILATYQEAAKGVALNLKPVGVYALVQAFETILKRQKPEVRHQIIVEQISISRRMQVMLNVLEPEKEIAFSAVLGEVSSRLEILVSFLALLELVRLKLLKIYSMEAPERVGEDELYLKANFASREAAQALVLGNYREDN